MANRFSRDQWRTQVERYLASDMSVAEWCRVNRLSESSMFKWIGNFADREPELFGGSHNIEDRCHILWS
ncbi:IS66 family insertion sequence element accessory protein TnpA [Adlercreutzia sp. ZJ141]|uniref:IS66 family insertion sequence element accessory protein TnpA n=1 Tax=Adlercreutzia sp. ZJ141 TaxID=2709406 RepID=UPI0013ED6F1E|nr:transposase [Adlercreutzia sp. ZJ141]